MKPTLLLMLLLLTLQSVAQDNIRDSLFYELKITNHDTSRVIIITGLGNYYQLNRPDSALFYLNKAVQLARQIEYPKGEVFAMRLACFTLISHGNFSKALQLNLEARKVADENKFVYDKAILLNQLGMIYNGYGNYENALNTFKEAKALFDALTAEEFSAASSLNTPGFSAWEQSSIGITHLLMNELDSARYYGQLAYDGIKKLERDEEINKRAIFFITLNLGKIWDGIGDADLGLIYFRESSQYANNADDEFNWNFQMAELFQKMDIPDSSIFYARKSLGVSRESNFHSNIIEASILLSELYEDFDSQKALEYNRMAIAYKDSLYNQGKSITLESFLDFDEQQRQRELESVKAEFQSQLRNNTFLGTSFILIVTAILLYRSNRIKGTSKYYVLARIDLI